MKKICTIAESPSASALKRSATLSTTGRSFTTGGGGCFGDNKTVQPSQRPLASFVISKPTSNDSKSTASSKLNRLTKVGSKRVTLQTSTTHRYDESFMRYVNGFDSYFKASELRNQSSSKEEEARKSIKNSRLRYATEASTSVEATSSGSLSDTRSFSLDSPKSQKKRGLPRVSLVFDTAPHIDLLDSPKSFSETASSYYATPDQDRSFITTPSENYSFFATASEQSSYLTAAELDSLEESHTFVQDAKQFSSQETLYNDGDDDDIFKDDEEDEEDEDEDEDELRDGVAELARPSSSTSNVTAAFSRLKLRHFEDQERSARGLRSSELEKFNPVARVRRLNLVRSTCIDLEEDDDDEKNDKVQSQESSTTLDASQTETSTDDSPTKSCTT